MRKRRARTKSHEGFRTGPNARPRSSVAFDEDIYLQIKNLSDRQNISFAHAVNKICRHSLQAAGRLS